MYHQNASRFVLSTSEILNAAKAEPDNLAGCIIYLEPQTGGASVLCTHLEAATTAYILIRVKEMVRLLRICGLVNPIALTRTTYGFIVGSIGAGPIGKTCAASSCG